MLLENPRFRPRKIATVMELAISYRGVGRVAVGQAMTVRDVTFDEDHKTVPHSSIPQVTTVSRNDVMDLVRSCLARREQNRLSSAGLTKSDLVAGFG